MLIKLEQKLRRMYEHAFFLNHVLRYRALKKLWVGSQFLRCASFSLKVYAHKFRKCEVLLINPYKKDIEKGIPVGIATIVSYLQKHGVSTCFLDMNVKRLNDRSLKFMIRKVKPLIVGIGAITYQADESYRLGRLIRESFPQINLVHGGVHSSFFTGEPFEKGCADFVVIGEGEQTLLELVKAIKSGKKSFRSITGLVYKSGKKVVKNKPRRFIQNLNSLPFPAYHELDLKGYNTDIHIYPYYKEVAVDLIESRGCPNNCAYCATPQLYLRNVRLKDAKNILAEVDSLRLKYGMNYFHFHDDNFLLDRRRIVKFCRVITEDNTKIKWVCLTDVNSLNKNKDLIPKLSKAGCVSIEIGLESADVQVLKKLNRHQDIGSLPNLGNVIKKNGIVPLYLFMSFLPGETLDSVYKTSRLLDKLNSGKRLEVIDFIKPVHTRFGFGLCANPYPGSKFFNEAQKEGIVLVNKWAEYYPFCLNFIPNSFLEDVPVKKKELSKQEFNNIFKRYKEEILYNRTHNQIPAISIFPKHKPEYSEFLYNTFSLCDSQRTIREICKILSSEEDSSIREVCSAIRFLAMFGLIKSKRAENTNRIKCMYRK